VNLDVASCLHADNAPVGSSVEGRGRTILSVRDLQSLDIGLPACEPLRLSLGATESRIASCHRALATRAQNLVTVDVGVVGLSMAAGHFSALGFIERVVFIIDVS